MDRGRGNSKLLLIGSLSVLAVIGLFFASLSTDNVSPQTSGETPSWDNSHSFSGDGNMTFYEEWCTQTDGNWLESTCYFKTSEMHDQAKLVLDESRKSKITGVTAKNICSILEIPCPDKPIFDATFNINNGISGFVYLKGDTQYTFNVKGTEIKYRIESEPYEWMTFGDPSNHEKFPRIMGTVVNPEQETLIDIITFFYDPITNCEEQNGWWGRGACHLPDDTEIDYDPDNTARVGNRVYDENNEHILYSQIKELGIRIDKMAGDNANGYNSITIEIQEYLDNEQRIKEIIGKEFSVTFGAQAVLEWNEYTSKKYISNELKNNFELKINQSTFSVGDSPIISGFEPEKEFIRIIVFYEDQQMTNQKIQIIDDGFFEYDFKIQSDWPNGQYYAFVEGTHLDTRIYFNVVEP